MKQKKSRHGGLDDTRESNAISVGSASTGSYDTTENLTDTDDASSPLKCGLGNKSRVRFAIQSNQTHPVESHNEFSDKERGNYWWSDREKDRMMAKHERLVAKYELYRSGKSSTKNGKKLSADKLGSYRGLESWTAAGSLKLDHTIEQCITAVMDEQDRQWNENDDDADVIAQKSFAVTEDSARRARLNGLQDAQEALRIRGEDWSKTNASDEISVVSAMSTGTAAVAKKKKRSKLLARLDDSGRIPKSSDHSRNDVIGDLKKSRKKTKKSKKAKKSKKDKSSKSKKVRESDDGDTTDTKTTQPNTVASHDQDKTPLPDVTVPVSPLGTPETSSNIYQLVAALRKEQEKLNENSTRSRDSHEDTHTIKSIYDRVPEASDDDDDDLVKLLRAQQKKNERKRRDEGGNAGVPTRSGAPVSKLSSLREDYVKPTEPPGNHSDPPGRRPRRLASKQGDPNVPPRPYDKKKKEKRNDEASGPSVEGSPSAQTKSRAKIGSVGGILKKSLFKKGAKANYGKV